MLDLNFTQSDSTIAIEGPPPWVDVSGTMFDDGGMAATGMGEVAGFPDVAVEFNGLFTDGHIEGSYQMGVAGGLPQEQPIDYQVQCPPAP